MDFRFISVAFIVVVVREPKHMLLHTLLSCHLIYLPASMFIWKIPCISIMSCPSPLQCQIFLSSLNQNILEKLKSHLCKRVLWAEFFKVGEGGRDRGRRRWLTATWRSRWRQLYSHCIDCGAISCFHRLSPLWYRYVLWSCARTSFNANAKLV